MHRKCRHVVLEICVQTDRQTDRLTRSSQYHHTMQANANAKLICNVTISPTKTGLCRGALPASPFPGYYLQTQRHPQNRQYITYRNARAMATSNKAFTAAEMSTPENERERRSQTNREEVDFKDEEVKTHRQSDGTEQPLVAPWRHHQQRLILRDTTTRASQPPFAPQCNDIFQLPFDML